MNAIYKNFPTVQLVAYQAASWARRRITVTVAYLTQARVTTFLTPRKHTIHIEKPFAFMD